MERFAVNAAPCAPLGLLVNRIGELGGLNYCSSEVLFKNIPDSDCGNSIKRSWSFICWCLVT